jgi:hypothetical protein
MKDVTLPTSLVRHADVGGTSAVGQSMYAGAASQTKPRVPRPSWAGATPFRVAIDRKLLLPLEEKIRGLEEQMQALLAQRPLERRSITIATLDAPNLRIRQAISVELTTDAEGFVTAQSHDLEVYGAGDNDWSAIAELRERIADEFLFLVEHQADLAPGAQALLHRYQQLVEVLG